MEKLLFEKKRTRVKYCPCGKSNRDGKFAPYVGFDDKGYCHSCYKTFLPEIQNDTTCKTAEFVSLFPNQISFIDLHVMEPSLKGYDQNNFVLFMKNKFGKDNAMKAVKVYRVGTSKRWPGANIFWQIDHEGKIRGGKIMLYDFSTGKRQNKNSWVHSVLKLEDFRLNQCFFGSHLLRSNLVKNVAIVESEKTAIIASILKPEFIWMAAGGKGGLRPDRCVIFENRNVFLFPDLTKIGDKLNCYELWTEKAKELSREIPRARFYVSDYLETNATEEERNLGLDIADYFLKWEWENERNEQNEAFQKPFNKNDEENAQIRSIETEISMLSKQIAKVIEDLRREKDKETDLGKQIKRTIDKIRNCEIPDEAIRANKELLKKYRVETRIIQ